jgi:mono/diheme cytochrome c family protein
MAWACGVLWFSGVAVAGAALDVSKLPPAATGAVDFGRHIQPLFEASCWKCHGSEKQKSGFRLDNRDSALAGGEHGRDILPGESSKSPLIHYVARLVEDLEMPPDGKGKPLTPDQVGLLRAWIDQGAKWDTADSGTAEKKRLDMMDWWSL